MNEDVTCAICGHKYHECQVLFISGIHICGTCTGIYHVPAVCSSCGLPLTYTKEANGVVRTCTICNTAGFVAKCVTKKHTTPRKTYYGRRH